MIEFSKFFQQAKKKQARGSVSDDDNQIDFTRDEEGRGKRVS